MRRCCGPCIVADKSMYIEYVPLAISQYSGLQDVEVAIDKMTLSLGASP